MGDGVGGVTKAEVKPKHPATYSRAILAQLDELVPPGLYLDPCAGVGKIFRLDRDDRAFVAIEIERPWADVEPRTIHGDMFEVVKDWIRLSTVRFDGIVVSWVYGNRMSDHHNARDTSRRHSYTHDIRTMTGNPDYILHPNNSGTMYFWQQEYKDFHEAAYALLLDAVNDAYKSSFFNVKNFYRTIKKRQELQPVVGWHVGALKRAGWEVIRLHSVTTPGMRYGENYEARADEEVIIEARKPNREDQ